MKDLNHFADLMITEAKIYTANPKEPWADTVAIKGDRFLYVGNREDGQWQHYAGPDTKVTALSGQMVIPGMIDGHTHPEAVAKSSWSVRLPETDDLVELMAFVKKYCEEHSVDEVPYFFGVSYPSTMFGTDGPKKELLDRYISDRPARLQDFSDHSCWYNSKALELMEIEKGKPDPEWRTTFERDKDGEPTGWAKEPSPVGDYEKTMFQKIGWFPPEEITEEMVTPFLNFLNKKGIVAILDGITEEESSIKVYHEMDLAGKLNMYYEGTCLLTDYQILDTCIRTLRDWQAKYTSRHIKVNTIKYFLDGTNEIGTCAVLEPFSNDPEGKNCGTLNMSEEELTKVILRLNQEGIDLHIHLVGDRAFRTACNAYEKARKTYMGEWSIYLQLAHCELADPKDILRAAELGIFINWSTHWSGGFFGEAAKEWLGEERFNRMYDFTKFLEAGGIVTYGSDVTGQSEAHRADPFFGMECAHTRIDPEYPLDSGVRLPESAKLPLDELIRGYTLRGAIPLRMEDKLGSIETGKLANLSVLNKNLFETPPFEIHTIMPTAVVFEGRIIFGEL